MEGLNQWIKYNLREFCTWNFPPLSSNKSQNFLSFKWVLSIRWAAPSRKGTCLLVSCNILSISFHFNLLRHFPFKLKYSILCLANDHWSTTWRGYYMSLWTHDGRGSKNITSCEKGRDLTHSYDKSQKTDRKKSKKQRDNTKTPPWWQIC